MKENIYRFDFGTGSAANGYIKITGDMVYSDKRGYGVEKKTEGIARTKGEKPSLRDYLLFNDNSFRIKLENGRYRVRISSGDYEDIGDVSTAFRINNTDLSFWIHENEVKEAEAVVDVAASEMVIKPVKGRRVCLNAVDIAPAIELESASVSVRTDADDNGCKVQLSWDAIKGAAGYLVERVRKTDGETDISVITKNTSFTDEAVSLCEYFDYKVVPVDDLNFVCAAPAVAHVCVTDGGEVTDTVTDLTAAAKPDSVSLKWKGTAGILYYNIYKKTPYGLSLPVAQTDTAQYTDNEVITCVPYEYAVEGITTSGPTQKAIVISDAAAPAPKRQMETLDRGAVAFRNGDGIFISWRLRGWEYDKGISFIVERNGERITDTPIEDCTCMQDNGGKPGDKYTIKAVRDGKAEREGFVVAALATEYIPIPIDKPEPYIAPDGQIHEYYAADVMPGDLDGDGEYEFVLKWMAGYKDNSHKGITGIYYLDGYKMDGTKLWRIGLGVNIRCGAHYAQVMVADFDGDGKAEIICKTADGTMDAAGTVIGDPDADYRNADGFIIEGDEYLSAFDGETGTLLDTVPYDPPRGNVIDWGDSWGNRVDRFLACVAYLDGVHPSAVMCRGYYDHGCPTVLAAWDIVNKKLVKRWVFRADKNQNINYTAQGHHSLYAGDVDGDGMDEIVYGGMAVDHDGRGMYSTGLGHGDAQHLGKFLPHAEGLQYFGIQEEDDAPLGYDVHDPATGEIKWGCVTGYDTGRGMCAKIDPRYEGNQVWAIDQPLFTFDGRMISEECPKTNKFPIWWDGGLLRDLLDYTPDEGEGDVWENGSPKIYKWDWENGELKTIFEPEGARSITHTKGTPCLQADVIGDWRENLIFTDKDSTELRIYTSAFPTKHRFFTLMHDPLYRNCVSLQNTAYNTPPHTGFYIGTDMDKPSAPVNNTYLSGGDMPEFTENAD